MSHFDSKQDYFRYIANQFGTTPNIIEAIAYGEEKVVEDQLAAQILAEFVHETSMMFFAMVWEGTPLPGGIDNIRTYSYLGQMMQGLHIFLHKTSYISQLFLTNALIADTDYFRRLLQVRPNAGFIIIGADPESVDNILTVCHETNRPYIFTNYPANFDISDHYLITTQSDTGMHEVVRYLHQLGHERIAFIHGYLKHKVGLERLNEYYAAMEAVGLPINPEFIQGGDWQDSGGYSAGQKLLTLENKPTAIIAANDRMAIGVMQIAHELGLQIPQDVSVVGFDNIADAMQVKPTLSSVHQPLIRMGSTMGKYLIALLEGDTPEPRHCYFPVEFIIRDSIGVAKHT